MNSPIFLKKFTQIEVHFFVKINIDAKAIILTL